MVVTWTLKKIFCIHCLQSVLQSLNAKSRDSIESKPDQMEIQHLYQRSTLSPRRRRTRPQWNQGQEQHNHTRQNILLDSSLCFFEHEQSKEPEMIPTSLSSMKTEPTLSQTLRSHKSRKIFISLVVSMCLIVALMNKSASSTIDLIRSLDGIDDAYLAVRRRLISPGVPQDQKSYSHPKELRFLSFGGPLTYGRGLDERKRSSQAYPYLLSSPDNVHNVAQFSYGSTSPTMASLCTQSIVENTGKSFPKNASIEYNVITLEYSFATVDITEETYISSMELLMQRLHQRYPLSEIILVKIWTPSDLVVIDKVSKQKTPFEEWKRNRKHQHNDEQVEWSVREQSQSESVVEDKLKAILRSVGGSIANLPLPETLNETLVDNWFLEEPEKADMVTNIGPPSLVRYTLSPIGHATLAHSIQHALKKNHNVRSSKITQFSSSMERLYSWGSGDSCQFWYHTGLQNPRSYSGGMTPNEIDHGSYILEVKASKGGKLQVHNPFDTDKFVYLTYLTASEMATSNKVYPKTKVKMVLIQPPAMAQNDRLPRSASTSVLLDPSHGILGQHQHHFTRTSVVGLLPALQTGTLEFTALEEYTIHPFRILGVSILHEINNNKRFPFEFSMFSPQQLSVDKGLPEGELDDDKMEEEEK